MHIVALTVELRIPGCRSLKHKRSRLKPLLARLHREFNISAAEIEGNDSHSYSIIACVIASNDGKHAQQVLAKLPRWIEVNRPDMQLVDHQIVIY